MPQTLSYEEFAAGGAAPPQAAAAPATRPSRVARQVRAETRQPLFTTSTVIVAKLSHAPRYAYVIARLVVILPPTFHPLVRPKPSHSIGLDWDLATEETLGRFMAATEPLLAERGEIVDACFREWRLPTPAEQHRFDEAERQFDIACAIFERTLSSGMQ